MNTDTSERFADLGGEAFARLVARTWREYGWEVDAPGPTDLPEGIDDPAAAVEGGTVLLAPAAERPVVLTVPGGEPLSATALVGVLSGVESPEELLLVAAAGFEGGAVSVADAYGVDLVGPAALARLRDSTASDRLGD